MSLRSNSTCTHSASMFTHHAYIEHARPDSVDVYLFLRRRDSEPLVCTVIQFQTAPRPPSAKTRELGQELGTMASVCRHRSPIRKSQRWLPPCDMSRPFGRMTALAPPQWFCKRAKFARILRAGSAWKSRIISARSPREACKIRFPDRDIFCAKRAKFRGAAARGTCGRVRIDRLASGGRCRSG
jgi:hypothetical protein